MELRRATQKDANTIWQMQIDAFGELLSKYEDYDTSPGNEVKVMERIRT